MKTVIFGCGKIANRIANAFKFIKDNELVGFASKDLKKAQQYSLTYQTQNYGHYEDFLNDDSIDAVYIATANNSHYDLIKQALLHHKHVVCEKPMLTDIDKLDDLFNIAKENNLILMEAMKSLFLPINIKVKEMLKNKIIGDIKYIEATFIRGSDHSENHWINDIDNGALKDIGSYCASILLFLLENKPTITYKYKNNSPDHSDNYAEVLLRSNDIDAHILVSNAFDGQSALKIYGTKGYIVVSNFWKSGNGYYVLDNQRYEIAEEMINDFYYEIKHFTNLIKEKKKESEIMSQEMTRNIMEITR